MWEIIQSNDECVYLNPVKRTTALYFNCFHKDNENMVCKEALCPIKSAGPQIIKVPGKKADEE